MSQGGRTDLYAGAVPVGRLTQLVFECGDPGRLAAFWGRALDTGPAYGDADWLTLEWEPVGRLSFHRVHDYRPPEWPGAAGGSQVHFDLLVDDLTQAASQVLALGASSLSDVLNPGPRAWQIFADPAGHPFCLVSTPE